MKVKYTIAQFNEQFPDDATCLQYLFDQNFPNGGTCAKCSKTNCFHPVTGRKSYACAWCGHQVSPTAGTIFHKSSTSLKTWFHAMFILIASRNGVSAMELMRQTGVTYKTAFRMNHQIRQLMNEPNGRLHGIVEADETYIGGVRKGRRGRGAAGKTPVIGIKSRATGKVVVKATPDVTARSLVTNICKNVQRNSIVMTDELASYKGLRSIGFDHKTINHSERYVDGDIHTNGIESFWAQFKRSINGTFHHVSPKHLQKYLHEFAWRQNHREASQPLFCRMIETAGGQHDSAV